MGFVYSLVRFTPDPAFGEFVNIAVIVGGERWDMYVEPTRARILGADKEQMRLAKSFLAEIADSDVSYHRLMELSSIMRRNVQVSPPAWVQASSLEDAGVMLAERAGMRVAALSTTA